MISLRRTGRHVAPLLSALRHCNGLYDPGTGAQRSSYSGGVDAAAGARVVGWGPVENLVAALGRVQETTQLPWWILLSLTAVSLRVVLFPLTVKQMQATGPTVGSVSQAVKIVRSQKKSEKNEKWGLADFRAVLEKFQKLTKYSNAPHPSWTFLAPLIQIPCFLICVMGIRRMCRNQWPGFAEGGILWFTDLTQSTVHFSEMTTHIGPVGAVLPVAITLSYLTQIHFSFHKGRLAASATSSTSGALTPFLKVALEWLSLPILVITLQLPQGALVYWLTSSLCTVSQSLLIGNSAVRQILRLPMLQDKSHHDVMVQFTPQVMDLFLKAAEHRARGSYEEAIDTLRQITLLEPHNPRAHYALGQLLGEQQRWEEAIVSYRGSLESERDPKLLSRGFLGLGVAQFMKEEFESSESSLISSLNLDSSNVAGWMALCSLYKRMGDSDRAKATLQRAISLDPNCRQWEKHL